MYAPKTLPRSFPPGTWWCVYVVCVCVGVGEWVGGCGCVGVHVCAYRKAAVIKPLALNKPLQPSKKYALELLYCIYILV